MDSKLRKEGWLARWLKRLADASDREWQGKAPECCAGMRSKIELCGNKSAGNRQGKR